MTAAMFKYRLMPGSKLPGINTLRMYGKSVVLNGSLFGIIFFLFLWLRLSRLSRLKDLGESRFNELNDELRRLPIVDESRDSWRMPRVEETTILSAYLDTRPEVVLEEDSSLFRDHFTWAMIRIIGIIPVRMKNSRLICHYRYKHEDPTDESYTLSRESMGTRLSAFEENFGMAYCAAYILCELPGRLDSHGDNSNIALPYGVTVTAESVTDSNDLRNEEFVVVRYPKNGWKNMIKGGEPSVAERRSGSDENGVAVCVQPLHHGFDEAVDLVAFVEFYRMMGVDRFTFYRDNVGSRVNEILEHYSRHGLATIIEWRLPDWYVYERNLRVDGIFAALNDCLYRSTFHASYRYVAAVDIDEYIVPRRHENFQQMMDHLNPPGSNELTGAWIFRNIFFYLMHQDDSITLEPGLPRLKLHAKTMRWRETNRPRDRSKFIVQGRDIIDLGNHHVWRLKRAWSIFGKRYREVAVDPLIAGSHHYRKCETNVEACWQRPTEIDRVAHRFTAQLAERVSNITRTVLPMSRWKP